VRLSFLVLDRTLEEEQHVMTGGGPLAAGSFKE
jgi:hypothetical protein